MSRTELARVEDIPSQGAGQLRCTVDDTEIGLYKINGNVMAWRNVCPHEAAPVCRGVVAGTRLESPVGEYRFGRSDEILRCPWHGWEFDLVSGEHLAAGSGARLRAYPIEVRDGVVYDAAGLGQSRALRVRRRRKIAAQIVELELEATDAHPLPSWAPGAHVEVQLPSGLIRHYSLCGDPRERTSMRIAVLKEQQGRGGSAELHSEVTEGTELMMLNLRNRFPLRHAARYLFIAGGIGITAMLTMAQTVVRRGTAFDFVYVGRTPDEMAYRKVVKELPGSRLVYTDAQGLPDLSALIQGSEPDTAVYCCGPGPMIDAVRAAGEKTGRTVHVERYSDDSLARAEGLPARAFEVHLAESGQRLTVGADESILEALRRAGVDAPSSCESGWCGSCETKVLAGTPDHRDSVLTEDERTESNSMMICISRSIDDSLTLDR